ncbi:hypothetical protein FRX31_010087 [Thalictrum thalictroides]|uniref:MORF/ORRM1/DAG-like MORF domain-containing protein n=1 Tax=Thalictrum thalictroides TaxID=46969 RepID=A0A7J6WUM0_THATH|nr:hypothetical protein FRX31_010087 [Thalictrum thalictroides]
MKRLHLVPVYMVGVPLVRLRVTKVQQLILEHGKAVGILIKEAKQRIYLISACPDTLGFGAYVHKEIADKLKGVECIESVSPDFFDDMRRKDPRTRRMSQLSEHKAESAEVQNFV